MKHALAVSLLCLAACKATKESPSSARTGSDSNSVARATHRGHAATAAAPECGGKVVRDYGVGALRIGDEIDSVRAHCSLVRDTTALGAEGMPSRKATVRFGDDSVIAEIVNGKVWRIEVRSSAFATTDSLRVGSPIARMLQLRNPRGLTGEGQLFLVSSDHCGLSFRLSKPDGSAAQGWAHPVLSKLPSSTVVSQILVVGCPNPARSGSSLQGEADKFLVARWPPSENTSKENDGINAHFA
jgi:hypothetical protein